MIEYIVEIAKSLFVGMAAMMAGTIVIALVVKYMGREGATAVAQLLLSLILTLLFGKLIRVVWESFQS